MTQILYHFSASRKCSRASKIFLSLTPAMFVYHRTYSSTIVSLIIINDVRSTGCRRKLFHSIHWPKFAKRPKTDKFNGPIIDILSLPRSEKISSIFLIKLSGLTYNTAFIEKINIQMSYCLAVVYW